MLSINKPSDILYVCSKCSKKYKIKTNYDKHLLMCNLMSKTVKERRIENINIDNTPSTKELYSIILRLSNKCEMMERKIEKLTDSYNKEKKKINVIEWLNNQKNNIDNDDNSDSDNDNNGVKINNKNPIFSKWIETVNINEDDMESVVNNNFMDGLKHIIKRLVRENEDYGITFPIKAFEQKEGLFYIYDIINIDNGNNFEKKWIIMSAENLNILFSKITKGLIKQIRLWKDNNINKMSEEGFAKVYANNIKKVTGGDVPIQTQQLKFRKYLYNIIKINIKNIIEYEYEF